MDSPSDVEVRRGVVELAARLGDRLPDVVAAISASLRDDIPDLRDEAQLPLVDASVEGNVTTALYALAHDTPVECVRAPTAALEQARRIAQQGLPVSVLVRIYRLGQRSFTHLAFGELQRIDVSPDLRVTIVERITETLFAYVDWMSQQVVEAYEEERERWLETRNSMRALRVREVLAGRQSVDIDAAMSAIRYPLRWHHVALVVWYPAATEADELARMQRFVRELGVAVQAGAAPLFIAADRSTGWAWLSFQVAPDGIVAAVREFSLQHRDSPGVAIGSPAAGVPGFRRSHAQAEAVRSVVLSRKDATPTVVADSDPGLAAAALVCGNIENARAWVAEVLGGLATDTDNDARLRETLRVFLNGGSSYTLAADELTVHFNTVKYRVGRALARRGRPITDDRFDIELALLLCHWYGGALLLPPKP
ncbi:MAG: helix-turn-helix domain-containing protein [Mycobacterium sp.]|nr:helix-turn-helix domain-containing protein [Mycobacterium sp.]